MPKTLHHIIYVCQYLADSRVIVSWWNLTWCAAIVIRFQSNRRRLIQNVNSRDQFTYDLMHFSQFQRFDALFFRYKNQTVVEITRDLNPGDQSAWRFNRNPRVFSRKQPVAWSISKCLLQLVTFYFVEICRCSSRSCHRRHHIRGTRSPSPTGCNSGTHRGHRRGELGNVSLNQQLVSRKKLLKVLQVNMNWIKNHPFVSEPSLDYRKPFSIRK